METIPEIAAGNGMPIWLDMFIAIVAAFGGLELLKYLLSLRSHRRKDKAAAQQEENIAVQQDVEIRQKEYELMKNFLTDFEARNRDLNDELRAYRAEKEEDRKIKQDLRYKVTELERVTSGLQKAFNEEKSRRLASDRRYCEIETCKRRRPPLGTYDSDAPHSATFAGPGRDEVTGRFVSQKNITN